MTSPHLSNLTLDELAAGLQTSAAASAHLEQCESCRQRLNTLCDDARRAVASPRFAEGKARLVGSSRKEERRSSWTLWLAPPTMVLAAASVFLMIRPPSPGPLPGPDHVKGSYGLQIVPLAERQLTGTARFHPGEKVRLAVSAQGEKYALILGVDEAGHVQQVWPPDGGQSGLAPRGTPAQLAPAFAVTSGSMTLHALFSDEPIAAKDAISSFEARLAEALKHGENARSCQPPMVSGAHGQARAELEVINP